MSNKIEAPIYLVTADVYLRFPEIMEEEYRDLLGYLDYEHILYERCTGEVNELQQLKETIDEVLKFIDDEWYYDGTPIDKIVEMLKRGKKDE